LSVTALSRVAKRLAVVGVEHDAYLYGELRQFAGCRDCAMGKLDSSVEQEMKLGSLLIRAG
jgi:hypothetical protein